MCAHQEHDGFQQNQRGSKLFPFFITRGIDSQCSKQMPRHTCTSAGTSKAKAIRRKERELHLAFWAEQTSVRNTNNFDQRPDILNNIGLH